MRRTLLAAAVLLLIAGPAAAYTIFLKDGTRLNAREKYRVVGGNAIIILPSGSQTVLPLANIDVPLTERSNASDFGSATVLEQATARPQPTPTRGPSLSDVAANRRLPGPAARPAAPAPAPAAPEPRQADRTVGGNPDLLRVPRTPLSRVRVGTQLGELLRSKGLEAAALYEGTQPDRVLIEVETNSEGAVFQALAATSLALLEFDRQQPGVIEAIELFMATDKRTRAGQFVLTPARARELATKQLDVAEFFIKYVEF